MTLQRISTIYGSDPVGFAEQPLFWNAVVRGRTRLEPTDLLDCTQAIERALGRQPSTVRNAPRAIDIDLLLFDQATIGTATLTLPHPRLLQRAFCLRPSAEIAGEMVHPATGRTLAEHWAAAPPPGRTWPLFPGAELLGPGDGAHGACAE